MCFMKSNCITLMLGAGVLMLLSSAGYAGSQPVQAATSSAATATAGGSQSAASGSMCASNEKVVFSCSLAGRNKVVSMCAAGDVAHGAGRFYYAYGHPGAPELVYPAPGQNVADPFTRSHLGFAGATGGYAYSFVNNQFKYVVYSISGTGVNKGGVIVQRNGAAAVVADMKCQQTTITESDDDSVLDSTLKWKNDPSISAHGLPAAH
jgi:hypothetical protein